MSPRKEYLLLLSIICAIPACTPKRKSTETVAVADQEVIAMDDFATVDIPLADDSDFDESEMETVQSFFDEDIEEFVVMDEDDEDMEVAPEEMVALEHEEIAEIQPDEFAWVDAQDEQEEVFKEVYFEFDRYSVRADQQETVVKNIDHAKEVMTDSQHEKTIVIEGHACHSAGSAVYNLALSEKRAKVVADMFVSAGVDEDHIKVVGRGQEVPAMHDGEPISGSREEQWPNRRVEVHTIDT